MRRRLWPHLLRCLPTDFDRAYLRALTNCEARLLDAWSASAGCGTPRVARHLPRHLGDPAAVTDAEVPPR
jgi:hypothetical protein